MQILQPLRIPPLPYSLAWPPSPWSLQCSQRLMPWRPLFPPRLSLSQLHLRLLTAGLLCPILPHTFNGIFSTEPLQLHNQHCSQVHTAVLLLPWQTTAGRRKMDPTNYFMSLMHLMNDCGKDLCTYPYFSYSFPKWFFTTAGDTILRYLEGDKSSLCLVAERPSAQALHNV